MENETQLEGTNAAETPVAETMEAISEPEEVHTEATDEVIVKTEASSPLAPTKELEGVEGAQSTMSTPFILAFLFVVFFVLKSFIYTKDDKRHGK